MNNQLIFIYLFLLFSRQIRVNLRKYLFCMTTASSREIKQKEKFLFKARAYRKKSMRNGKVGEIWVLRLTLLVGNAISQLRFENSVYCFCMS